MKVMSKNRLYGETQGSSLPFSKGTDPGCGNVYVIRPGSAIESDIPGAKVGLEGKASRWIIGFHIPLFLAPTLGPG